MPFYKNCARAECSSRQIDKQEAGKAWKQRRVRENRAWATANVGCRRVDAPFQRNATTKNGQNQDWAFPNGETENVAPNTATWRSLQQEHRR